LPLGAGLGQQLVPVAWRIAAAVTFFWSVG